jgi:hypothetical protein
MHEQNMFLEARKMIELYDNDSENLPAGREAGLAWPSSPPMMKLDFFLTQC